MAEVTLVFLGRFREAADQSLTPPADVTTIAALKDWLMQTQPQLAQLIASMPTQIAVNQQIVRDAGFALTPGDEVAFLPPMSGG